ncbi:hypothetical protein MMC11_007699 [Xylographa trunciseda]|nr:hypothetical protein [Xylographa trunciseda]
MALGPTQMTLDLGGLTQWAASIGSRGLKQLATSGVQLHSLGCMLMIAELTPASTEFRRMVSRERQQQRSERLWYFKVVEVGAASNFLADQLLKTRAGENVVGLLTAIASTMDEASCTTTLSMLFDVASVSLDNTPGIGEFEKIREALLPLVRRTEFKERVAHYHYRLRSFSEPKDSTKRNPYEAIPHDKDIPNLIYMLSALAKNPDHILNYHGIIGAGWVAAYATYILGIRTCAIDGSGNTLPINGILEDSRVIIWVSEPASDARCKISVTGKIEDFIVLETRTERERTGWSINCTKLSYIEENTPGLRETTDFLSISEFVAAETMNVLFLLVSGSTDNDLRNFIEFGRYPYRYYMIAFESLFMRALEILRILGFHCPPITSFLIESRQNEFSGGPRLVNKAEQGGFLLNYLLEKIKLYDSISRMQYLLEYVLAKSGSARSQDGHGLDDWSEEAQHHVSMTMGHAARIAAHLAFTNWPTSLQLLSVNHFYHRESFEENLVVSRMQSARMTAKDFLPFLIPICTDSTSAQHLREAYAGVEWTALDIDGLIVLRSAALSGFLNDFKGQPLNLHRGRIAYEGTQISMIRRSLGHYEGEMEEELEYEMRERQLATENNTWELLNPDYFETLKPQETRQTFIRQKDILFLRHEILYMPGRWQPTNPDGLSLLVPNIFMARSCNHDKNVPLRLHFQGTSKGISLDRWKAVDVFTPRISSSLSYRGPSYIRYYPLENNLSEMSSAFANKGAKYVIVLQAQTCFLCTIHQITELFRYHGKMQKDHTFYIIRIPESDPSSHPVPVSSTPADFEACRTFNAFQYQQSRDGQYQDDACPASVHTPCCLDRLDELELPKRVWKTGEDPCIACVPMFCPHDIHPCKSCTNIYNSSAVGRPASVVEMEEGAGAQGNADAATNTRVDETAGDEHPSDWEDDSDDAEDTGGSQRRKVSTPQQQRRGPTRSSRNRRRP